MEIDNGDQTPALYLHQGVNNLTLAARGSEQYSNNTNQLMNQEIPLAASTANAVKAIDSDTILAILQNTPMIAQDWLNSVLE